MKTYQEGPIVTITAGEALTKNRFVDFEGKHTADKKAIGVTLFDVDSGDDASIQASGICAVEAGGAITAGSLVSSDADGKAVALTLSALADVEKICGIALDAASADGDYINVALR